MTRAERSDEQKGPEGEWREGGRRHTQGCRPRSEGARRRGGRRDPRRTGGSCGGPAPLVPHNQDHEAPTGWREARGTRPQSFWWMVRPQAARGECAKRGPRQGHPLVRFSPDPTRAAVGHRKWWRQYKAWRCPSPQATALRYPSAPATRPRERLQGAAHERRHKSDGKALPPKSTDNGKALHKSDCKALPTSDCKPLPKCTCHSSM